MDFSTELDIYRSCGETTEMPCDITTAALLNFDSSESSVSGNSAGSPSSSDEPTIVLKTLLDKKRCDANRKERERVDALRKEFSSLRGVVPKDIAEPELTRIDVVRRAAEYIDYLTNMLQTADDHPDDAQLYEGDFDVDELRSSFITHKVEENTTQILPEKRRICNARARDRSKRTKVAFDQLKTLLPIHQAEPELSRMDILRRATQYIAVMQKMLEEEEEREQEEKANEYVEAVLSDASVVAPSELSFACSAASLVLPTPVITPDSDYEETAPALSNVRTPPSPLSSIQFPCSNTMLPSDLADSDYGTMSPPASANSDCSFTFPSINTTTTTTSCATTTTSCIQSTIPSTADSQMTSADCNDVGSVGCIRARRQSRTLRRAASQPYSTPAPTTSFATPSPTTAASCLPEVLKSTFSPLGPLTPVTPLSRIFFNLVANNQVAWSPRLASQLLAGGNIVSASVQPPMTPVVMNRDVMSELSQQDLQMFFGDQCSLSHQQVSNFGMSQSSLLRNTPDFTSIFS